MRSKRFAGLVLVALITVGSLLLSSFRNFQAASQYIAEGEPYGYMVVVPFPDQEAESEENPSGFLEGTVTDEAESPLRGIKIELIPTDKSGDQRWYATRSTWTDEVGKYRFDHIEPGEYLVAALKRGAPDGRQPFAGSYYPDGDDEAGASRLWVNADSRVELPIIHLRRLETVTLEVRVVFEDGTVPPWSNLLFHNVTFPSQAVIGDEAPGIENGRGEFILPKGFEYKARAKVDCDAGPKIETRESRPVQLIKIEDGYVPEELVFTIPGSGCKLWSPK